jgi:hypothetical protein
MLRAARADFEHHSLGVKRSVPLGIAAAYSFSSMVRQILQRKETVQMRPLI